jgi:hypothetical protein
VLHKATAQSMSYWVETFSHFEKKIGQMNVLAKIPLFKFKKRKKNHNRLQCERVLQLFYFHILNIAKFG